MIIEDHAVTSCAHWRIKLIRVDDRKPDFEGPSVYMSLLREPISNKANTAVECLLEQVEIREKGRKVLRNHVLVMAAVVADLLKGAAYKPIQPCFRSMDANGFTGMRIGYRSFKQVLNCLVKARMVTINTGYFDRHNSEGKVTRIRATSRLLDLLSAFGLNPANVALHFARPANQPLVALPIHRRKAATRDKKYRKHPGRLMRVSTDDPKVMQYAGEVNAINQFVERQSFEGMIFDGLVRTFNNGDHEDFDWNKGGRLYAVGGSYQGIKKDERKLIRINGEPTSEVDISGSHLTILHALTKTELPNAGDPYMVPGLSRIAVKVFANATIGNGVLLSRWSNETAKKYAKRFEKEPVPGLCGIIEEDYPFGMVRDNVLSHIPLLKQVSRIPFAWDYIQFRESKIIISSIMTLIEKGIPCLPLHDSLICGESNKEEVWRVLYDTFYDQT
jgi:hypothetical protein